MRKVNARHGTNTIGRLGIATIGLLVLTSVPLSHASSLDPVIVIGDPSTGTPINSTSFSFHADAHGGGIFNFVNDSGQTWLTLDFFINLPSADTITCSSSLFSFCGYSETTSGSNQSLFDIGFEQANYGGISPGAAFTIDLNDSPSADKGSWGGFAVMNAVANFDIPEPSTFLLAFVGLVFCILIATYRRVSA